MAKGCYIGVDGVARKVKKGYVGVDGVARKIKKAYIGIGGVARPCWGGGELAYYGTITGLSEQKYSVAATTVGDYALFGGGRLTGSVASKVVDAYDKSLTRTVTSKPLQRDVYDHAATTVGDYALFGGGYSTAYSTQVSHVTAFNKSLTYSSAANFKSAKHKISATTVGSYALFGPDQNVAVIDAYNEPLTRQVLDAALSRDRYAAATVGDYAIFAGGYSMNEAQQIADVINSSLTATYSALLKYKRYEHAATTVGDYALFGGGWSGAGSCNRVDAVDSSLTVISGTDLTNAAWRNAATTLDKYALFVGGSNTDSDGTTVPNATVDVYDTSLTKTRQSDLSAARSMIGATTVGEYALFGGGYGNSLPYYDTVDAFTIA